MIICSHFIPIMEMFDFMSRTRTIFEFSKIDFKIYIIKICQINYEENNLWEMSQL